MDEFDFRLEDYCDKRENSGGMEARLKKSLEEALTLIAKESASDLYIKADLAPVLRIQGELHPMKTVKFTAAETLEIANSLMNEEQRNRFARRPEQNLMHDFTGLGRFRVNIYQQRNTAALVFRRIVSEIKSFDELGLPPVLKDIALTPRGLVLITGPIGSGKSTTIATMLDWINQHKTGHILTVEDPIEFLHQDKKSIFSQREIGSDTRSFSDALKNAVRQAPDVILIGEMRDQASVSSAVFFAETGHLVISSLHSVNANQALERILNFFPSEAHRELLMLLSLNMRAIVSQRLVPKLENHGRVVATEILLNNARFRELLRLGDFHTVKREIDFFAGEGMQSMDMSLLQLYRKNLISMETALDHADSPNDLRIKIKTLPPRE